MEVLPIVGQRFVESAHVLIQSGPEKLDFPDQAVEGPLRLRQRPPGMGKYNESPCLRTFRRLKVE
jgi:hypothetical protein